MGAEVVKLLLGIAALVAVEYLLLGGLVVWYWLSDRLAERRLRRECWSLSRELERMVAS